MEVDSTAPTLRVVDIVEGTCVDGPGLRTSIYLAGCEHACSGCHNSHTWPHDSGRDMTVDEIMKVVDFNGFNVTLSGGDPVYQRGRLKPLLERLYEGGYTVWLYTGFTYEQLLSMPDFVPLLKYFEAIVDGPYVESLRDTTLRFRGSSNQRIILLRER